MELKHTAQRAGRLSTFLKQELGLSTGLMNRLKWNNLLLVNGIPRHADYPIVPGDEICALLDDPAPQYPAEDKPLTVLFEDTHLLCVDKSAGMLVHPSRSCMTGTLANRVLGYYEKTGQHCAFHPVTRLDRDTFGVVLLAKNAHVHAKLNTLHASGQLKKIYEALVFGCPREDTGLIDAPIARKALPSLLREVSAEGKPSQTTFTVLKKYDGYSHLRLQPLTGRTHQLRVHCAYSGFPILGDPQYGSEASIRFSRQLGLSTQALCAKQLAFCHPITGQDICIESKFLIK